MSLTLSCKLVEVFTLICAVLLKSSSRFHCTLALNPAFSVAPIESPRYGGPLLLQTFAVADYNPRQLVRIAAEVIFKHYCRTSSCQH